MFSAKIIHLNIKCTVIHLNSFKTRRQKYTAITLQIDLYIIFFLVQYDEDGEDDVIARSDNILCNFSIILLSICNIFDFTSAFRTYVQKHKELIRHFRQVVIICPTSFESKHPLCLT